MSLLQNVEIFSVGKWKGSRTVEATSEMLDEIVQNFQDLNSIPGFGVPVKRGHSSNVGDPAYGWMSDLKRNGDVLTADFTDVPSEIIDAIGKRRYNSVSIELAPKIEYAGKTYKNVLAGVALLGSEWPAVKGLAPLSASKFAEDGTEVLELNAKEESTVTLKFTQEDADSLVLAAETRVRTELQAKLDDATASLTAASTRATVAETALKTFKADADNKEFSTIIDQAIKDGKLLDKNRAKINLMAAAFMGQGTVKVGDKEMTPLEMFKDFIADLKPAVRFGEHLNSEQRDPSTATKASDEVHEAVLAYIAEHGGKPTYEAGMAAVFQADPDLKARYAEGIQ